MKQGLTLRGGGKKKEAIRRFPSSGTQDLQDTA